MRGTGVEGPKIMGFASIRFGFDGKGSFIDAQPVADICSWIKGTYCKNRRAPINASQ